VAIAENVRRHSVRRIRFIVFTSVWHPVPSVIHRVLPAFALGGVTHLPSEHFNDSHSLGPRTRPPLARSPRPTASPADLFKWSASGSAGSRGNPAASVPVRFHFLMEHAFARVLSIAGTR